MAKNMNYEKQPNVPPEKRLDDSGDPPPVHIEAGRARKKALAEGLKPKARKTPAPKRHPAKASDKFVRCERCHTEVKLCNLSRHRHRSCKPKKAVPTIAKKPVIERVQCMYCNQKVANMKAHIKDKHGFLLLPDGTVAIMSVGHYDPNKL